MTLNNKYENIIEESIAAIDVMLIKNLSHLLVIFFFLLFYIFYSSPFVFADYTWTLTATPKKPHHRPTATLLNDGTILVFGYLSVNQNVEIYNSNTNSWMIPGNSLIGYQNFHTATLLNNGDVLIAGDGLNQDGSSALTAEVYNPSTFSWKKTDNLIRPHRVNASSTLLQNGKALIAGGGYDFFASSFTDTELYDPVDNSWSSGPSMNNPRNFHTATLLSNGNVLVAGGGNIGSIGFNPVNTSEIYDSQNNVWITAGNMLKARSQHRATLLKNGKVLVTGGFEKLDSNNYNPPLATVELYDPATNQWGSAHPMSEARALHTATLLPDGRVLVAGGIGDGGTTTTFLKSSEIYDPIIDSWTLVAPMNIARFYHASIIMRDGRVFTVGGENGLGNTQPGNSLQTAEVFQVSSITPTPTPTPSTGTVLSVPLLKQGIAPYNNNDPVWENEEFDHANQYGGFFCGTTIAQCGCAMTSVAMILQYHGVKKLPDGTPLNPGTFNTWLKNNNGYYRNEGLNPYVAATIAKKAKSQNPEFTYDGIEYSRISGSDKTQLIADLQNGFPAVLQEPGHFIVATGIDGNTFTINDPAYNRTKLTSYNNTFLSLGRYIPSHTDVSYIVLAVDKDIDIVLKNSSGEVVGESYLEYHLNDATSETETVTNDSSLKILAYQKPSSDSYRVEITDSTDQSYQLDSYFIDQEGNNSMESIDGIIDPTTTSVFEIDFDKQSAEASIIEPLVTFDKLQDDIQFLYLQKQIKNKGIYIALKLLSNIAERSSQSERQPLGTRLALTALRTFQFQLDHHRATHIAEDAYQILYDDTQSLIEQLQDIPGESDDPGGPGGGS